MAKELPIVCSLDAGDLEQRLAAIGEIGARSLVGRHQEGGRHLLRFRPDSETRDRLEEVIEAERRCCAFLDLSLKEGCCHLILSVTAPEAGQPTADGLAMAFSAAAELRPG
jgi:hypothetical protein